MKPKISLWLFLVTALAMLMPQTARADLGYWSKALVGTWMHPVTKQVYTFNSNATYFVVNGLDKPRYVMEQGYWKIAQPTEAESGGSQEGPVALILKTRKRTTEVKGKRVTRPLIRDSRHVVDTISNGETDNTNRYYFDGVKLKRIS